MVRDLVEAAINMVRDEREAEVEELANERVDERLLDLLLPVPTEVPAHADAPSAPDNEQVFFVSGSGGITKEAEAERDRHQRTRDKLKALLIAGELDNREV
jgi:ATP-dependent HslUV protease ATP-binding subunit HslU